MDHNKYIFPEEIIQNTAEFHFHHHNSHTKVIYQSILGALTIALIAIFFIKVDVNVKSNGLLRSIEERTEIKPLISGRIDSVFIKENSHVKAGQILLTVKREALEGQSGLVDLQQADLEDQLGDLNQLIHAYRRNRWPRRLNLKSGVYAQQYTLFVQHMSGARSKYALAKKNYDRYTYLYKNRIVSTVEYDEMKLQLDNTSNELRLIGESYGSRWQTELNTLKIQNRELSSKNEQFSNELGFYTLRAAVTGSVQQLKGIQPGSLISANEILGEISPDSGLIAETYVLPKDIGLLRVGTKARFQIDAFNYNQWGMVEGSVTSISNDIFMGSGQQPFFKVRCRLNKHQLTLENGYIGKIKKGMTLQARFFVTRRTLFQLLYDKADDWLNPNVINNSAETTSAGL